jgi:predicted metal-dependent peptidase
VLRKACWHEPGGIERPLEQARQSERDWRAILRDFIATTSPSDYRWAPNRRFISSGLYLLSIELRGVGDIVIAVDTSGSIGTKELEQFAGEINAIASEAQPESICVNYCDRALEEPISCRHFKWVEENGIEPKCLIYLTGLCCNSFRSAPDYPVLWVTDSHNTAPFGETLRIRIGG